MKFRVLAVMALVFAFALIGMPAASAHSNATYASSDPTYQLCLNNGAVLAYCVWPAPHEDAFLITNYAAIASISFINKYTTSNGNAWYELETQNGLCLNWDSKNELVYSDSCVKGDANELWYNHVAGELINLAGNKFYDADTYLNYEDCITEGMDTYCYLFATDVFFNGWVEYAN
jgi:hypothetical protein